MTLRGRAEVQTAAKAREMSEETRECEKDARESQNERMRRKRDEMRQEVLSRAGARMSSWQLTCDGKTERALSVLRQPCRRLCPTNIGVPSSFFCHTTAMNEIVRVASTRGLQSLHRHNTNDRRETHWPKTVYQC